MGLTAEPLGSSEIRLVPLQVSDAEELAPPLFDVALHRFTGGEPPGLTELRSRFARQCEGASPDGRAIWLNWVVRAGQGHCAVGTVQATVTEGTDGPTAELAWVIGTGFQGRGLAKAATRLVVVPRMHSHGSATDHASLEPAEPVDAPRSISGAGVMGDHLLILHSAVRACPGYSRHDAPSILLDGSSMARDTEHGRATTAQLTRRHGTLEEAIAAAVFALGAADVAKSIRRQARAACEDYFYGRLDLTPTHELDGRQEIAESLELMPEPMYQALEDVVGLVVDGDYEELRVKSGDRLRVEDLRRRVEDDCPESLVLAAREVYQVEAITKSDDPELPGWAYFLDLWTESGPARLHIEGELEESGERFMATLTDILP